MKKHPIEQTSTCIVSADLSENGLIKGTEIISLSTQSTTSFVSLSSSSSSLRDDDDHDDYDQGSAVCPEKVNRAKQDDGDKLDAWLMSWYLYFKSMWNE